MYQIYLKEVVFTFFMTLAFVAINFQYIKLFQVEQFQGYADNVKFIYDFIPDGTEHKPAGAVYNESYWLNLEVGGNRYGL